LKTSNASSANNLSFRLMPYHICFPAPILFAPNAYRQPSRTIKPKLFVPKIYNPARSRKYARIHLLEELYSAWCVSTRTIIRIINYFVFSLYLKLFRLPLSSSRSKEKIFYNLLTKFIATKYKGWECCSNNYIKNLIVHSKLFKSGRKISKATLRALRRFRGHHNRLKFTLN
jgi:hypothetical protein